MGKNLNHYWEGSKRELQKVVDTLGAENKANQDLQEEVIAVIAALNSSSSEGDEQGCNFVRITKDRGGVQARHDS